ncbi:efflux RND transporter periplasmic adaptor subunit [uncultured Algimonas sp.]|uniref:efflux RND transporter periplasmic adaptor subunit n=1 Tax=uncultured Algimonas sp. TaxID=1547920 RepID=UPI00261ECE86|nr:efflux RND transporter periplasmic adaptor subunit [uncultured Algimonas sp.]
MGISFPLLIACSQDSGIPEDNSYGDRQSGRPVEAAFVTVWSGSRTLSLVGTLSDPETTNVAFEVGGTVQTMSGDIGTAFVKGERLATIEPATFRLAVSRAEADLARAEAELADAQSSFDRRERLAGSGAISAAALDATTARLDAAKAGVKAAQAGLDTARDSLSDTVLRAPYDGRIVRRLIEPGQVVSPSVPILRLAPASDRLEAEVGVPEAAIGRFEIGQSYPVYLPALDRDYDGVVTEIGASARSTLSFPVVLSIADSEELRSGMAVEIRSRGMDGALRSQRVPSSAVQSDGRDNYYVYSISDGGLVRRVGIEPLELNDDSYIIRSPLQAGDRIVARGAAQVMDGETVRVVNRAATDFGG